jgi:hypothetical protein
MDCEATLDQHYGPPGRELHSPFDDAVKQKFGLTVNQIIDLFLLIVKTIEGRLTQRMRMLRRAFRDRKPKRMIRTYYKENRGLNGDPDELIGTLSAIIHDETQIMGYLLAHSDLQLPDFLIFLDRRAGGYVQAQCRCYKASR